MTPARLCVVALLVATALPLGATAEESVACPAKVTTTKDGWRRVAVPAFESGYREIRSYAVVPHAPRVMLVTNGSEVMRTTDDGCTWNTVFSLPDQPSADFPLTAMADIVQVVAGGKRVYALVRDGAPRVLVSSNGGSSWQLANLPPLGTEIASSPPKLVTDSSGMYAYVTARPIGIVFGAAEMLLATDDGGATWNPRPIDVTGAGPVAQTIMDIAVDPLLGTDIWAVTDGGLFRSGDAGESWTWTEVGSDAYFSLGSVAVVHRADTPVHVVVASAYDGVVHVRRAGGGWTTVNTPGMVTSITGGRTLEQVAITTAGGAFELHLGALSWQPMHRGAPTLSRLSTDDTALASYYACACDEENPSIWSRAPRTFKTPPVTPPKQPGSDGCAPDSNRADIPDFGPSAVTSAAQEIAIPPGKSVKVPYTFRVRPRELDLYYLIDTGPRSVAFSCLAKQGAIWTAYELAQTHNLRVGIGQYRDYLVTGELRLSIGGTDCLTRLRRDFVYKRDLGVGPVDAGFRDAVSNVGYGSHCTADFAALPALLQAATGAGQDLAPKGPSPYDIAPGQDAMFSPDAYKVILHVAGGYFNTPTKTRQYPGPEFEPVIAALNSDGIKQVGINVPYTSKKKHHGTEEPPDPPEESGEADLRRIAAETGTLAAEPVECGNRLRTRVAAGEPLVCTYLEESKRTTSGPPMGRLMKDLMSALRDVRPMGLSILSGDARITSGTTRSLDYLRSQSLTYEVTFSCKPSEAGLTKQIRFGGEVGSMVVATNQTTVRCGSPPDVPKPPFFAAIPQIVQRAAPLANPPPNTNVSPQTATQANSQLQQLVQGAMTHQEESQHEVALATIERPQVEDELAMSALPRQVPVPPWATSGVAAMVTFAAAWEVSRRVRTAHAPVRVRR